VRDEGWAALVARSILVPRRDLRLRAEVSAADAGPVLDAAKDTELLAWMVRGAYAEVPFAGQRAMSTRWVLTIKPPALPGLHPRPKARFCVRGNEDRDKALIESFSPAVSRSTVRLLLSLLVTMGWAPRSVDVSTAFLQGMPIDRPDPVYVRPPHEAGVARGLIWLLAKCTYGLVDAPRMWYERVFSLTRKIGAVRSAADPSVVVLLADGAVILSVSFHVDDLLFGGTAAGVALFESELRAAFSVGPVAVVSFVFTGLAITLLWPRRDAPRAFLSTGRRTLTASTIFPFPGLAWPPRAPRSPRRNYFSTAGRPTRCHGRRGRRCPTSRAARLCSPATSDTLWWPTLSAPTRN